MSASSKDDKITVSVCNTSVSEDEDIVLDIRDADITSASAQILTGEINAHNTFEAPDTIMPEELEVSVSNGKASFKLPAKSIAVITLS